MVLALDYRLGPEHPFPAAHDDAELAYEWAQEKAYALGADEERLVVAGDSAGANLAFHLLRIHRGDPRLYRHLLFYPAADLTGGHPSRQIFSEGFLIDEGSLAWFQKHAISDADPRDFRLSPLLAPDLSGCAKGRVVTAGFDPLRDEGERLVARLREAGVSTCMRRHPGLMHGFAERTRLIPRAQAAVREAIHWLRDSLH